MPGPLRRGRGSLGVRCAEGGSGGAPGAMAFARLWGSHANRGWRGEGWREGCGEGRAEETPLPQSGEGWEGSERRRSGRRQARQAMGSPRLAARARYSRRHPGW
jgi:hypothetical protein